MPTRRLAAIMFTDIAGYTKLMQQSEARANELRTRHREVFENAHQTYNGQIIQYFGDGTLSTFASCVEAVQCAIDMQKAFQEEPKVPLRIGIHLGDIVWSDKDVMGDGVNLASRVESLGIPGSILISDDVNKQIRNQEIETVNMGTFGMKNVDTPLEVFAVQAEGVVLPSPKDLKGKGRRLNNILKARRLVQFASVGFLAMAIGALIFWASGAKERSQLLPESIREEKVAVSVFENFTGDEDLDALGYLGSEWISSGLRELKVRTVSPEMVRQSKETIGVLPNNPQGKSSFAEITGARYVVAGSYFLEGDSILLKTRLSSTETGEDLRAFPTIRGHKDQKEKLVEDARQYLLGYWVLRRENKLSNLNPPKYEAYQAYIESIRSNEFDWGRKALELDPNFFMARDMQLYLAVISDDDSAFYEHKAILDSQWSQSTEYEKNAVRESVALWEGNYQAAFEAIDGNYYMHPNDWHALHESGFVASRGLNRLNIAIDRYEQLFDDIDFYEKEAVHHSFNNYFDALNRNGDHKKVTDFYSRLSEKGKKKVGFAIREVIVAYIYQNQIEKVKELLSGRTFVIQAAYAYAYINPDTSINPFNEVLRKNLASFEDPSISEDYRDIGLSYINWDSRAMAFYILREWQKAEEILVGLKGFDWDSFMNNPLHPNQYELWVEATLGCIFAQQGKREDAIQQIRTIQRLGEQFHSDHHSHFIRGEIPYLISRIYACLDDKEKAVEYLHTAIEQGRTYDRWNITFDLFLVNLKGYPPFEALIAPRKEAIYE